MLFTYYYLPLRKTYKPQSMKKIILCAMMIFSSVALFAQSEAGEWHFTPYVGVSLADCTFEAASVKPGLLVGAEAMYQATDIFGISGGVFYAQEGCKKRYYNDDVKVSLHTDYINIPLLANVYVAQGLALKVGIQPSVLISSSLDEKFFEESGKEYIKEDFNPISLSMPFGVSYEMSNIVMDIRYNLGLTSLVKDVDVSDNARSSVFQLMVGYRF